MKKTSLIYSFSLVAIFVLSVSLATAQGTGGNTPGTSGGNTPAGCTSTICIPNPLKGIDTIPKLLTAIIDNIILPVGGILCVFAFILAGFLYVTAQGNSTKISQAHRALLYAAIGTALVLGAKVFSDVIQNTIHNVTTL